MKYLSIFKTENEQSMERYSLIIDRIKSIIEEETVEEPFRDYFKKTASFLILIDQVANLVKEDRLKDLSLEELQDLNYKLYEDILESNYETSYANPSYASSKLGKDYGQLLSFLYTELRGLIASAFEGRIFHVVLFFELFVEVYNQFEQGERAKDVKRTICDFISDNSRYLMDYRTRESLDPDLSFAADIIMNWDLNDLRYLYQFGEYIGENEIKIAQYLNGLEEDKVKAMAFTYVDGYVRGFEVANIDLSKKKSVNIRYNIGFERMIKYAIEFFAEKDLRPVIYRAAAHNINKRQHLKIGYQSTGPNKQYDYDHRFDDGLYLTKKFKADKLEALEMAYEKYKELAFTYAGPALIEVYGEENFLPKNKESAVVLSDEQEELLLEYNRDASIVANRYIKGDETSFTIIAYPIPEIGENFVEIFNETVKVNTLDNKTYQEIQQRIIDVLDQGEYVRILGKDSNKTDLKVMLSILSNPDKETRFENCTADVNIPVGEVFTSPKLTGTSGILNVSQVYLNDLEYIDLCLEFKDGMITSYDCKNFDEDSENKKYIKENLMYNHDTLPIGEFAIGTNTTAYVMARKYDIQDKLPILIAEKTGPHFAVGDTCYKMSEELKTFNPDGKEIVAKDNEVSILRKTDISKAYYNCHTDITIPYNEIKEISVYNKDGSKVLIIEDGRFVLSGTEKLNEAFEY
ncbi:MAG: aminopeptidase [Clostridiales bacterium]|nr:aminopeptidase [Clostridiales bacterium]